MKNRTIFLLASFLSLSLIANSLSAGVLIQNAHRYITDGVFYPGLEQEIEDALFEAHYDPNGRIIPGGSIIYLESVECEWVRNSINLLYITCPTFITRPRSGRRPRVYPWMNEPDVCTMETWKSVKAHMGYTNSSIMLYG